MISHAHLQIHLMTFQGTRYCAKDPTLVNPDEIKAARGELQPPYTRDDQFEIITTKKAHQTMIVIATVCVQQLTVNWCSLGIIFKLTVTCSLLHFLVWALVSCEL